MSSSMCHRLIFAALVAGVLASVLLLNKGLQADVRLGQLAVLLFLGCVGGFAVLTRRRR